MKELIPLAMEPLFTEILQLYKQAAPLKELPRIGWIVAGGTRNDADSIAAHSYIVVLTTLVTTKQLQSRFGAIDLEKALTMATIHDLSESVTGDLNSGFKRRVSQKPGNAELLKEIETDAFNDLVSNIHESEKLKALFSEFNEGITKEAKIVMFADMLDAVSHAQHRFNKVSDIYLANARKKLECESPGGDSGVGLYLSEMLAACVAEWKTIHPTIRV